MKSYGLFTQYSKDGEPSFEIWLKNADGQDFYELRNTLAAADAAAGATGATYLALRADRSVQVANNDVDLLFPQDLELVSIDKLADASVAVGQVLGSDGALGPAPARHATTVSRVQGLIQLHRSGLYDAYNEAVTAADAETQIWAANAPLWSITNTNLLKLAAALKLTSDQVQALFDAGAQIA